MYPRVEIAEAAVQHKLPDEFIQELKQEKIEYFETKHSEAGVEALQLTVKDMETAERMVEQSWNGSARQSMKKAGSKLITNEGCGN